MDFSQYGEPSEEWTYYVSEHPIINQGWSKPDEALAEMATSGTAIRAANDKKKLEASGLQGKFTIQDYNVPTRDGSSIPLRVYIPNGTAPSKGRPIYVYFHGGGFLHGSIDTEGLDCASIATSLDLIVIHPCPRLAHEVKHPTIHHDAWEAIDWITENAGTLGGDLTNVVIGGVSSGANFAASATQHFFASSKGNDSVQVKGQVLVVPWLIQPDAFPTHLFTSADNTSLVQNSDALGLPTARLKWLSDNLEAGDNISDPLINPPLADDNVLRSLPKTALIVAGGDPLRDDALLYATRLKQVGVPTKVHVFPGMPHHFSVFELPHPHVKYPLPSAKVNRELVLESIQWALVDGEDEPDGAWKVEKGVQHS